MNEREFAELAAGHALNALTDADEKRYADALAAHPEWSEIAEADAGTAAMLADAATPVEAPTELRDALLARIGSLPQEPATGSADPPPAPASVAAPPARRRRLRLLFALAASLVLLVGIGVGAAVLTAQLMRPASVVALEQIEDAEDAQQATVELEAGGVATAHWSESLGTAVLVTEGLESLGEGQTYELWYVRGDDPVSAGLFQVDGGTTTALLSGELQAGDAIAVTVEPTGGSPTGAPTSDPILVIPTA